MGVFHRRNKFRNVKSPDGYDSLREARKAKELWALQRAGAISDLKEQVRYELLPRQNDANGKLVERACAYIADFTFRDPDGTFHLIDTKGFRTPEYKIKRKLLLFRHGIRIEEC